MAEITRERTQLLFDLNLEDITKIECCYTCPFCDKGHTYYSCEILASRSRRGRYKYRDEPIAIIGDEYMAKTRVAFNCPFRGKTHYFKWSE